MKKYIIAMAVIAMMLSPVSVRAAEVTINNYAKDSVKEEMIRTLQLKLIDLLSQMVKELQRQLIVLQEKTPEVIIKESTPPTVIVQQVVPQTTNTTMPTEEVKKEVLDASGFFKETDVDHKKVWVDNNGIDPLRVGFRKLSRFTKQGDIKLTVTGRFDDGENGKLIETANFGPGNDFDASFIIPNVIPGEKYSYHLSIDNAGYTGSYDGEVTVIAK
jgi:hypothetical protein